MRFINIFKGFKDKPIPEKMTIPEESQKQMLEFFMRTSIPRRKAKLASSEKGKEVGSKLEQEFISG